GATNARFARESGDGRIDKVRAFACDDHASIEDALATYLAEGPEEAPPQEAAFAWAGPVTGDAVALTNHPWSFTISGLTHHLRPARLLVGNDFAASAQAVPRLKEGDRFAIGAGAPAAEATIGVLGPGSGLGMAALVPTKNDWIVLPSEGGHATMAPADARESAVLDRMRRRFDHVSAERALSGPGLVNLYNVLAEI